MASPAPVIIAAAVGRARRQVVAPFLVQHAITPGDAIAFAPEKRLVRKQFEQMLRHRIIHDAGGGRYWLDLPAYNAEHARRHRLLLIVIFIAALFIAASLTFFYKG